MQNLHYNYYSICICVCARLIQREREREREMTPDFRRMQLGSLITSQPSRQPGTSHLFDIDPSVITGTIDPNTPIGTNGLVPKVRW